eukprot:g2201.t1
MTSKMRKRAGLKEKSECVKVIVRVRPLSKKERANGNRQVAIIDEDSAAISVGNPTNMKGTPKQFTFDRTYGPNCRQEDIYNQIAAPVVKAVLQGFNGTVFAYGQTGAGKTFTMEGVPEDPDLRGIIPRTFRDIFDKIAVAKKSEKKEFLVRASYLEIYNEEIRDLLSRYTERRLEVKEGVDSGVYVEGLEAKIVKSVAEISDVLKAGKKNRSVGATLMNQTSSRSHSIFTIIVETSATGIDGKPHITVGKLNLVDLAGSERQSKTKAKGQRFKEATKINLSLSALGNVISTLVDGKSEHVPYRDSKLTRLLQDSLGGNTKTVMCANCGPADYNYDETLSTLRYANRAKQIKNKPKINEDPKDAMLREMQEKIMQLRKELEKRRGDGGRGKGGSCGRGSNRGDRGVDPEMMDRLRNKSKGEQEKILREIADRKRSIEMKKVKTEEERAKLEKQLKREEDERRKQATALLKIQEEMAQLQKKVLVGGNALDKAAAEARELKRKKIELQERKLREERMACQLAAQEEDYMELQQDYDSLHEEATVKTQKLKKLYAKYQQQKAEVKDIEDEFNRERETILADIRALNKELKHKNVLLDRYVPENFLKRIEDWAHFDEVNSTWVIKHLEYSGNSRRSNRRHAKRAAKKKPPKPPQYAFNPYYEYDKKSDAGAVLETSKKSKARGRIKHRERKTTTRMSREAGGAARGSRRRTKRREGK